MKIYDCFTFYNEFDLLDIRLSELYTKVDRFVIVESNQTFTNKSKPWNFDINRYPQYADKITYIQVTDMPNSNNPWDNEIHQRNSILRGLTDATEEDIVIISDADELLRPVAIDHIRNSDQTIYALRMPLFNFKFNYMRSSEGSYHCWAMATKMSTFKDITPDQLRNLRHSFHQAPIGYTNEGCEIIEHAGWHFGYLGDNNYLRDKAKSFSHQEVNTPEFLAQIDLEASIAERKEWNRNDPATYTVVALDTDYFPSTIINNQSQYKQYILDNTESKVLDFLPQYTYNH
jgi:hypothetical protein